MIKRTKLICPVCNKRIRGLRYTGKIVYNIRYSQYFDTKECEQAFIKFKEAK